MNYRATVVTGSGGMSEWNGRKVNIVRVLDNPDLPSSKLAPLIKVLDDRGNRALFPPEEIRTENLSEEHTPVFIGGRGIKNLHPVALEAIEKADWSVSPLSA